MGASGATGMMNAMEIMGWEIEAAGLAGFATFSGGLWWLSRATARRDAARLSRAGQEQAMKLLAPVLRPESMQVDPVGLVRIALRRLRLEEISKAQFDAEIRMLFEEYPVLKHHHENARWRLTMMGRHASQIIPAEVLSEMTGRV